MAKIAIDIVLLPSDEMMNKAIEANRELLETFDKKIVLNRENCLPHISLAMGCIDEKNIPDIEKLLKNIAEESDLLHLTVTGIDTAADSAGQKVSVFKVQKTNQLQLLHEKVMERLAAYFTYDVTADMLFSPQQVEASTLLWIKSYPEKSSFANFSPHITIGFGKINNLEFPIEFTASRLALCHLGNHCTCRKILVAAELKT